MKKIAFLSHVLLLSCGAYLPNSYAAAPSPPPALIAALAAAGMGTYHRIGNTSNPGGIPLFCLQGQDPLDDLYPAEANMIKAAIGNWDYKTREKEKGMIPPLIVMVHLNAKKGAPTPGEPL